MSGCEEREGKLQNQLKVSEAEKGMVEEQLKDRDAVLVSCKQNTSRHSHTTTETATIIPEKIVKTAVGIKNC